MKKQIVITGAIRRAIEKHPYGSQDGKRGEAKVIARLFYPRGNNAFYILEGSHDAGAKWDGDKVFGLCRLDGHEFEYGLFSIAELEATKAKIEWSFGTCEVGIERDITVDPLKSTIRECMKSHGEAFPSFWDDGETEAPAPEPVEAPAPEASADETDTAMVIVDPTETVEVVKSSYTDHLAEWKQDTADNRHTEVRVKIAGWAVDNATAETDELKMLLDDLHFIEAESKDGMTPELMDFRLDLDAELIERIGRVFGRKAAFDINDCL